MRDHRARSARQRRASPTASAAAGWTACSRGLRGFSRPTLLSIRNTFRRKGRLGLTLAALTLGGAVFMAVFSVRASLEKTLDDTLRYFAYDVQVELTTTERAQR